MGERWVLLVVAVAACAPTPDNPVSFDPLLSFDEETGRVATSGDAPVQFVIEFAGQGVQMPQAIFLDGVNRVATTACPYESGIGIGVYPVINIVAPVHGGPAATGGLQVVRNGPVIAELRVTWSTQYTCPDPQPQQAQGVSTFTVFPHGRIVRHDVATPSTTAIPANNANCGCSMDSIVGFTSFWTFALGNTVGPDAQPAVSGMTRTSCTVYSNHMIGVSWPDAPKTRFPPGDPPGVVSAHAYDLVTPSTTTLPLGEQQITSAIILSEETDPSQCGQVLADLDDFGILIANTMIFTDNRGIYLDDKRRHTDPVEIRPPSRLPKGFAISLNVGDYADVYRSPELDGDLYYVQADGDQTIFWFPEALDVGETITIDPR